ncbi:hypothetical protein [Salimicrobium flavidum]|uniref:Uncharacterized protein n=1 Tax=Salimicrobium flavidum TaxID=570947 RepID=A0A1N7K1W1_9BACI|nr:hypothetical protein [Salimicrobium flavidum]SIS55551.1 hypothetical protein SAMN05421687_108140 [Salimicrobium flavidum]
MKLTQFKDVFEDYSLSINEKITLHFSFEKGHHIENVQDTNPLDDIELKQVKNTITEFLQRNEHRQQLVQEIVDYAYHIPSESELKQLLLQIEEIKGISSSLIIEKLSERSPAFLKERLQELLQTIQEEEEHQE